MKSETVRKVLEMAFIIVYWLLTSESKMYQLHFFAVFLIFFKMDCNHSSL